MMKNKKNVPKKKSVKTRKRPQLPYFEISPDGTVVEYNGKSKTTFALGGDLSGAGSSAGGEGGEGDDEGKNQAIGAAANFIGSTAGDMLGADDNLAMVGDANKSKKIGGSALKGAGAGVAAGSSFGPVGMIVGGAIGGIAGAVKGNREGNAQLGQLKAQNEMIGERQDMTSMNTYMGAYGGILPKLAEGGTIIEGYHDMPDGTRMKNSDMYAEGGPLEDGVNPTGTSITSFSNVGPESLPNPNAQEYQDLRTPGYRDNYDTFLAAFDKSEELARMETPKGGGHYGDSVKDFNMNERFMQLNFPGEFKTTQQERLDSEVATYGVMSEEHHKRKLRADLKSGALSQEDFNKQINQKHLSGSNMANNQTAGNFVFNKYGHMGVGAQSASGGSVDTQNDLVDAATQVRLSRAFIDENGLEEFNKRNKAYSETNTMFDTEGAEATGTNATNDLKESILPDFAMGGSLAGTEMEMSGDATEYNGNKHTEGGIALGGNAEVEDGEVRVGDYVFSDQLETPSGKTFATEAKKITRSFEEYENDGPSMRTQDKMLKELQHGNDQARLLKQKEDAQVDQMMEQGALAYGGMISTDKRGKASVAKENRMTIRDAAKNSGMSYSKYVDGIMAYGGKVTKKKMYAEGGPLTEAEALEEEDALLKGFDNRPSPYDFGAGLPKNTIGGLPTRSLQPIQPNEISRDVDTSKFENNNSILPTNVSYDEINNLLQSGITSDDAIGGLQTEGVRSAAYRNLPRSSEAKLINPNANSTAIEDYLKTINTSEEGDNDKAALLAAQLPNLSNAIGSMRSTPTEFERVALERVSMKAERDSISKSIEDAKRQNRRNVRGTATSAGDALAALSAGNAGLTDRENDALTQSFAREENTNSGISNQEKMTNVNISNQEMIANQQDQAMRDSVSRGALAAMGENTQGYLSDKKKDKKNLEANRRIMDLLNTGEYKMTQAADGTLKIDYIDPKIKK